MKKIYIKNTSAITAAGIGWEAAWLAMREQRHLIDQRDFLAARLSDETNIELEKLTTERQLRHLDKTALLAILASRQLGAAIDADCGCMIGSSRGATGAIEKAYARHISNKSVLPATSPATTLGTLSAAVADDLGIRGPTMSVSAACATGLLSVGTAYAYIRSGIATSIVAGGSEASLTPFTMNQLRAAKVYARGPANSRYPYAPFSSGRSGMVLGEGAALVYLEGHLDEQEGTEILAFAAGHEKAGMTGISPEADGLRDVCLRAIEGAGLQPDDISFIVAHGAGTLQGDSAELAAYGSVFGLNMPPITSLKWCLGHVLGASGTLAIIMAKQMLEEELFVPLPYQELMFIPQRVKPTHFRHALICGLGFGGNAVAMVLRRA